MIRLLSHSDLVYKSHLANVDAIKVPQDIFVGDPENAVVFSVHWKCVYTLNTCTCTTGTTSDVGALDLGGIAKMGDCRILRQVAVKRPIKHELFMLCA